MILKGQKRKLPAEDAEVSDRSSPTWESQRQFVFSVSLSKYQHSHELPEPSLRRSVLIANTLRQVSLEACGQPAADGEASQPLCGSSAALQAKEQECIDDSQSGLASCPMASLNYSSDCAASRSPTSCHSGDSNVPMAVEDDDWGSMSTDPDFALSAAIASILTALDSTADGASQATPRTPLRSLENLSEPSERGAAWEKQGVRDYCDSWEQQQQECRVVRDSGVEAMRSSYLSDVTVEDLFQDIDTSLLEMDTEVLGLRSRGGGFPAGDDHLRYLPPFSPSASDSFSISLNPSQKCLPSFSSFSPLSLSSPTSFSSQSHERRNRAGASDGGPGGVLITSASS